MNMSQNNEELDEKRHSKIIKKQKEKAKKRELSEDLEDDDLADLIPPKDLAKLIGN